MCLSTIAFLISSMVPSPSVFGKDIWMRPDLIILGMLYFFVSRKGAKEQSRKGFPGVL
jgi:hypothetical protein